MNMIKDINTYKFQDEAAAIENLLSELEWSDARALKIEQKTVHYTELARQKRLNFGEMETFMREYGLETDEGLALMTLAEALLRIPDTKTASALIKDKISQADWNKSKSEDWLLKATSMGLNITKKTLNSLIEKLGEPVIRRAVSQAMKMMGRQFVLGRTIEEAMKNGQAFAKHGYVMSYDMLGEAARTMKDADGYFASYKYALETLARAPKTKGTGLSVKLSALHPRYEFARKDECVPFLTKRLLELCHFAARNGLRITVDAEEADRLLLSMEIIQNVMNDKDVQAWAQESKGFGLAVQAYQKRAIHLIDTLIEMAHDLNCPLHVRLVKGAYWDTEIKHAQVEGLSGYPVFTRKVNTDLAYMTCMQKMLKNTDVLYPMFGTHNAQTIATVLEYAESQGASVSRHDFEFQRLHGMGENLYEQIIDKENINISLYAPVGRHEYLLAYLVRRLLENGANSSFVNKLYDENIAPQDLAKNIVDDVKNHPSKSHKNIPLPQDIYGTRLNSTGYDLSDEEDVQFLTNKLGTYKKYDHEYATQSSIDEAFESAQKGYQSWSKQSADTRANCLERLGELLEEHTQDLVDLCTYEGGKTLSDTVAEIREAVDFCRYYAIQGRKDFSEKGVKLPSPTGESNHLYMLPRGIFVCISPWNFPLAIFVGQITAALMAGNAVIAKPAEQTPDIARYAVDLMHRAGIPQDALHLLIGDGEVGAHIINHEKVAGGTFTGSTAVAKSINLSLAKKDGPIVPLIAETGGQNAMIVDSSALTEQVVDDVILSAFGSAGQRCSALRILCLQDDIADQTIEMLKGAMDALEVGDPAEIKTDVGPVIDLEAKNHLYKQIDQIDGTLIKKLDVPNRHENFVAPVCYEVDDISSLKEEIFGPVLRIYRFKASDRANVIETINNLGYGLTFGLHSRIEQRLYNDARAINVGNVYVNRSTTGAVVGVQPFGGRGLSGTGPKAGGPHYLHRFATEKTITIDTTASGGNAHLISLEE